MKIAVSKMTAVPCGSYGEAVKTAKRGGTLLKTAL